MPLSIQDYRTINQVADSTFGRSSTITPGSSVKLNFLGEDRAVLIYTTVINLPKELPINSQKEKLQNESKGIVKEYIKFLKGGFKDLSGRTLKIKEISDSEDLEYISFNHFSDLRRAYYRKRIIVQFS